MIYMLFLQKFPSRGLIPIVADLPPARFDNPFDDALSFKNTGFDFKGPFFIASKDSIKTTNLLFHMPLYRDRQRI